MGIASFEMFFFHVFFSSKLLIKELADGGPIKCHHQPSLALFKNLGSIQIFLVSIKSGLNILLSLLLKKLQILTIFIPAFHFHFHYQVQHGMRLKNVIITKLYFFANLFEQRGCICSDLSRKCGRFMLGVVFYSVNFQLLTAFSIDKT